MSGRPLSDNTENPNEDDLIADESQEGLSESGPDEDIDLDDGEAGSEGTEDRQVADDDGEHEGTAGRAAQVRQPSRAERRFQTLSNRTKSAEERAQTAERRIAELEQRLSGRQSAEDQEFERRRLELLSPDEKLNYYREKDRQEVDRKFQQLQFMQADSNDRAEFERLCNRDPLYASVEEEVDNQLRWARQNGLNPPRRIVAEQLIGARVIAKAKRAKPKQQRAAAEGRQREQARVTNTRSNETRSQSTSTNDRAARAKRLENIEI